VSRREHTPSFQIEDGQEYDAINVKGVLQSPYDVHADSLNVKGTLSTDRDLHIAHDVKLKGVVVVNDIHAAKVKIHGRIQANNISAGQIKIVSGRTCSIRKVSGASIELRNGSDPEENERIMNGLLKLLNIPLSYSPDESDAMFKVTEIYGNHIELSNITAELVKGASIVLKDHCDIEKVVYTDSLTTDETCSIRNTSKGAD